jgi:1,4-dihydroxy-2-naphthoyl-CoA hydrolase
MSQGQTPDRAAWFDFFEASRARTVAGPLDISLVDIDESTIELRMPITDACRQPMGLLHGGVSMVLAETAASMHACWGVDLSAVVPVGVEIGGSHLRSAREGTVRALGRVVRRTRSLIVHQIDMYHVESGDHLCTARVTNFYKRVG